MSIGIKESTFEPSSPLRHASELHSLIQSDSEKKPILFLYSDGGPDHRLTYLSVQLSLIAFVCILDLDYLCAARTAPFHSWRNPVERILSIVNLGLQCVGLAREEMSVEDERQCSGHLGVRNRCGTVSVCCELLAPVQMIVLTKKACSSYASLHPVIFSNFVGWVGVKTLLNPCHLCSLTAKICGNSTIHLCMSPVRFPSSTQLLQL